MARRNKYLKRALDTLGLSYSNDIQEHPLNTISDLDFLVLEKKSEKDNAEENLRKCEELVETCKEHIKQKENDLHNLQQLKDQIEIEEYKELNPGKNILKL